MSMHHRAILDLSLTTRVFFVVKETRLSPDFMLYLTVSSETFEIEIVSYS